MLYWESSGIFSTVPDQDHGSLRGAVRGVDIGAGGRAHMASSLQQLPLAARLAAQGGGAARAQAHALDPRPAELGLRADFGAALLVSRIRASGCTRSTPLCRGEGQAPRSSCDLQENGVVDQEPGGPMCEDVWNRGEQAVNEGIQ